MNSNSIKQFLKPDSEKIIGVLIYITVFTFLLFGGRKIPAQLPQWEYGFPFSFISVYSINGIANDFIGINKIYYFNLVIDLFFGYLFSCIGVFLNIRAKHNKQKLKKETISKVKHKT